jgi:hypothetical protein
MVPNNSIKKLATEFKEQYHATRGADGGKRRSAANPKGAAAAGDY